MIMDDLTDLKSKIMNPEQNRAILELQMPFAKVIVLF